MKPFKHAWRGRVKWGKNRKNTHLCGVYLVCEGTHLSPAHTVSPKQSTFGVFYESYLKIWLTLLLSMLTFTYFTSHSQQLVKLRKRPRTKPESCCMPILFMHNGSFLQSFIILINSKCDCSPIGRICCQCTFLQTTDVLKRLRRGNAVVKVWFSLGTKSTCLRLGKDHVQVSTLSCFKNIDVKCIKRGNLTYW